MKPQVVFFPFVTLLLALAALAAACGDGAEALTLEEYFQRLDSILDNVDKQEETLEQPDLPSEPTEQDIRDAARLSLEAEAAIVRDALNALDDIDPPAEAEQAHNAQVGLLDDLVLLYEAFIDRSANLNSVLEAEQLFNKLAASHEFERFTDVCRELQGIADQNNVQVDLDCEERYL